MFCGFGERRREGQELYQDIKAAGVLPHMVMMFGQMNEPYAATSVAEHFMDTIDHLPRPATRASTSSSR